MNKKVKNICPRRPNWKVRIHCLLRKKKHGYLYISIKVTNEDDPAPTGSLSINDNVFDDYNEESDQDWASGGGSESDSEDSLIEHGILSHPAFHVEEDSLGDVDVDGPEDEGQYQLGR